MEVNYISPQDILPPHTPDIDCLVETLAKSMKNSGWKDRPLIALSLTENQRKEFLRWRKKKYYAITGSHRIAAAKKRKLEKIPVIILKGKERKALLEFWKNNPFWKYFLPEYLFEALNLNKKLSQLVSKG